MKKPSNITDRILLKRIYDLYYQDFCNLQKTKNTIYIPIDCVFVGESLGIEPQIVWGRLYYHLDKKYSFKQENDSWVKLILLANDEGKNPIHFPLLSSILAELEQSYYRFTLPIYISSFALLISLAGVFIKFF